MEVLETIAHSPALTRYSGPIHSSLLSGFNCCELSVSSRACKGSELLPCAQRESASRVGTLSLVQCALRRGDPLSSTLLVEVSEHAALDS